MAPTILSPAEAAALLADGDVLALGGNGGTGAPEAIIEALERRFLTDGHPRDLTLIHTTGIGAVTEHGLNHLAHEGLIARVVGGNFGLQLDFMQKLVVSDAAAAYNLPQGVIAQLYRTLAAKQPGVVTHVGLHTYMDPRQEGGKMNAAARDGEDLVELVTLAGREWLFYHMPVPTVAILRGTTADEDGYITMEHEATTREDLSIAQAVHNHGGRVICQVERLARRGALDPHRVKIPGFLVDHVVVVPDQMQTYATRYDPSRTGEMPRPLATLAPEPMSPRRVIARRAAMALRAGDVINLGVGISTGIANVAAEEEISDLVTFTVEAGVIGGVPGMGLDFGTAYNPRAIIDQPYQFDFYDGGGLDIAFLSFAEVDAEGNVNVTRFGRRNDGAGGFIDISQNARRLVFSGTLTGGSDVSVGHDGIAIRREGSVRKFVPKVGQISYNGRYGQGRGQDVLFVTERAVFRMTPEGLRLTEIAPGVSPERDVLEQIGFPVAVAPDLAPMDMRLFRHGPIGLRASMSTTMR
jgi:propionate CoA-transferase